MYNIAEPRKKQIYGNLIWKEGLYSVYNDNNRYILYINDYEIAVLINGIKTLNKKYKGSYYNWISYIKNKDLDKVYNTRNLIKDLENKCNLIESIWKDL